MEYIGLGDAKLAPENVTARVWPHKKRIWRIWRSLIWPWQATGRVILTSDPELVPSAWLLRLLTRKKWIAEVPEDYETLIEDRSWIPGPLRPLLKLFVRTTNALAARADLTIVADDHVRPRKARNRFVCKNLPDFTLLPEPIDHPFSRHAVYIGDLRESRGLRTMVAAIQATATDENPWRLTLIGPMSGADTDWWEQQSCDNVVRHDRMTPADSWRIAATADVGLCLLQDTPAFRLAVPSKVYEYFAVGLPVIATPLPRVSEFCDATRAGVCVTTADEVTSELRRLAEDAEFRDELRSRALAWSHEIRSGPSGYDRCARHMTDLISNR